MTATARYRALSPKRQAGVAILGVLALYLVLERLPGSGPFLQEKAPLGIILVGVVYGTVTSLLAMGLILIYRTNRFINFSYGAMGSLVGVLGIGMNREHGLPFFAMLPLAVVGGVIVGILVEFLVIRRFQNSSRLIVTVASIGLAQLLGGLELLGSKAIGFLSLTGGFRPPIDITFTIGDVTFGSDNVLIVAVVPAIIAGLAWFLLRTDAGVAVRAAAENSDRALLLGIPIRRLGTIVWGIAGGLAALTYILKAPFTGVAPGVASAGPTVLLPALAAAVVARMESLPLAFAAGVGLGVLEQVVRWNSSGTPTINSVFFLVVILGALLLQRGKLSRAQEGAGSSWSAIGVVKPIPEQLRSLPEVRWARAGLFALVGLAMVFVPHGWSTTNQFLAGIAMTWAMVGVSLVILTGWGGHISLGQWAVGGVGAMVAGNVISRWNLDFFFTLIVAGAAGAAVALLVGLPALRIRGLFLAVTTLAFAVALDSYVLNLNNFPHYIPSDVTRPLLWQRFDLENDYQMYLVCLAFLGLAVLAAKGIRRARAGRVVIASRDNNRAADAAAVPTTNVKLSAFVLAGVIAGVAGALHVQLLHSLNPGTYQPAISIEVFTTAVIGGLGSLGGAVIGILLFQYLETITALGDLRLALTGAGLLFVLYALPGGLFQLLLSARDRLLRVVAERRGILVPSLVADKREVEEDRPADEVDLLRGALGGVGVGR